MIALCSSLPANIRKITLGSVVRIGKDNAPVLDKHGHMIVEHDLEEIAVEFIKWGKTQGLAFCKESM
jgi:hypothetical protein